MAMSFLEGNAAAALGAFDAGCRFFAGYPITPATTIFNGMLQLLPPAGGVCMQGEDEIASMGFCIGASMAGMKVMTATSGPGISLYSEQISFAVGSEIPMVIVDVQRLGPSTGSATRGADGDIQFLRWGNSGGHSGIVLAPVDVGDCYLLTMWAFNLAEQFRCPVVVASNKEIGMTRESVDIDSLKKPPVVYRKPPPDSDKFRPFFVPENQLVPFFLPMGGSTLVRQTSSTHGPDGYITTDPAWIEKSQERLAQKLARFPEQYFFHDFFEAPGADTLLITHGVTSRAARACFESQGENKTPFSLLVLKTLWPVPEKIVRKHVENHRRVIVVEMNLGQYFREIERLACPARVEFFGQMNGRLITPSQIREVLKNG